MDSNSEEIKSAIASVGGAKVVAEKIGCSRRNLDDMVSSGEIRPRFALKLSAETGIHFSLLNPEIYPPELFQEIQVAKVMKFLVES